MHFCILIALRTDVSYLTIKQQLSIFSTAQTPHSDSTSLLGHFSARAEDLWQKGNEPLLVLCVQYRGDTFTSEDATDGVILGDKVEW